ncbi:MAG TPA: hypothetical protein VFH27_12080 [Longimicrobiaceae bacterium]|nr:hypothetical protein [Longimicrobiaceae bacterium]
MRTLLRLSLVLGAAALLGACDDNNDFITGGGYRPDPPRSLAAQSAWVLEGFSGTQAVGHSVVNLTWLPPTQWHEEPFRVYGRRSGDSQYTLIATVTSCTTAGCVYVDRDVAPGGRYDYYVATYDQQSDQESTTPFSESVTVADATRPAAPVADSVVALDAALYLRWHPSGSAAALWKYQVYLTAVGTQPSLYQTGETDGTGFVDVRAANGTQYTYRIAAVDTLGRVSDLSNTITGVPRPDARAELIYAAADSTAASGFRFQTTETANPIVAGTSASAQWRLEYDAVNGWRIAPLNGSSIVQFGITTDVACGPGADATCRAVTRAPVAGYQTTPIAVLPEYSYVLRVTGSDARVHYGVVRVTILGRDGAGKALMIFDWSYQTAPDEPRLSSTPIR